MNIDNYIGLTYKAKGRISPEVDCWGLARLYYKEELGIELPSFDDSYEADQETVMQELILQNKESWEKVESPEEGDLVLFRVLGVESHIGVMISPESFIHVRENMDSVKEDVSTPRWNKRIVGFYRYVENKSFCGLKPQSCVVQGIPHPLRTERYTIPAPVGTSISLIVNSINKEYKIDSEYEASFVVMVNGVPVPKHLWDSTFTQADDVVEYRCVPGKGAIKVIFAIALIVFATPLANFLAGGLTFGMSAAATATTLAIAKTAITLAGLALLRGTTKPREQNSNNPGSAERQLMLTSGGNRATPYSAIPVVLGKVRMSPILGAQNYLTFENGRDSYLSMLLIWGHGPLEISTNYKFGEVPIANYEIPRLITFDRKIEPPAEELKLFRTVYGKDVDQKNPQQVLACDGNPEVANPPGAWTELSTLQQADEVTISVHFPEGLRFVYLRGSNAGQSGGYNISLQVEKSPDGIGWFPVETINCSEFVTRNVTTYQKQQYACGSDSGFCTTFVPVVTAVTEPVAKKDAFTLNKTYKSAFANDLKFIRVRRTTGDNPEDNPNFRFYFTSVLQTVTFITNATPEVDPPNCKIAKTAIKIKANDQLNNSVESFNSIVQSIAPTWNGATWVDAPTSNPASLFIHVLTHPANPRRKTLAQLNLVELADFYNYCVSKGFEYNGVVAAQKGLMEVLREICAVARATPLQKDGKFTVVIDREKSVSQHFTPHNSWGFEAVKALPVIPHGLRVQYIDQDSNYQESEIIVYNNGYSQANASLFESMTFPGITKKPLVIDRARWEFAQGKLRPETYSLNVDIEHLICNKGDRVKVQSDVPLWGLGSGRVKNRLSSTVLELDEQLLLEVGKTYTIRIRNSAGQSSAVTVVTPTSSGYYSTVTLAQSLTSAQADAGDLFMFGELNKESQDLVVLGIEPADNMSARLILLDYGVTDTYNIFNQYSSQTSNAVFETQITLPPSFQIDTFGLKTPVVSRILSDESVMEVVSKGIFRYNMSVSYTNAVGLPNETAFVEAEYDISATADDITSRRSSTSYTAGSINLKDVLEGEVYKVRLRYVSRTGRVGLWSAYTTHTIQGKRSQPSKVLNFNSSAEKSLGKVRLTWNSNPEPDLKGYEVRSDLNFGQQNGRIFFGEEISCLATPPNLPGGAATYYICAVDYGGNYSNEIVATTFTYLALQEVNSISSTFADDSLTSATITISWMQPAVTIFDNKSYEISYDTTVKVVDANSIVLPADWLGNRSYLIRTVDLLGNKSAGVVFNVTKLAPNPVLNFRSQVIDNDVMLFWNLPARTSLPIDHIRVRKGATFATSVKIGEIKTEFVVISELRSGNFTYWASTVDTDQNESEPVALTAQVSEPPDFEFFGEFISALNSVRVNAARDTSGIVMPVNTVETWQQHFVSNTWGTPQDQVASGNPIYIQPALSTGYYEEVFDYETILASSQVTLDYNGINVFGAPVVTSSIAVSPDGINYTTYPGAINTFVTNFRYVKVRITASNTDNKSLYRLNYLTVTLDVKKKYDTLSKQALSSDALGTVFNFNKEFIDVQTIQATPFGTTPLTVSVDFQDAILAGTYSVNANICTVNYNGHGFITGQEVQLSVSSGLGIKGVYAITSVTANTFTVTMIAPNTTGNLLVYPQSCRVYVFNSNTGTRASVLCSLDVSGY